MKAPIVCVVSAAVVMLAASDRVIVIDRLDRNPASVGGFVGNTPRIDTESLKHARAAELAALCRDPFRRIKRDGALHTCDLNPVFKWLAAGRPGPNPMPAWTNITGTVQHTTERYVVVNPPAVLKKYFPDSPATQPFVIHNYPGPVADGATIQALVVSIGVGSDGTHTRRAYDYGEVFTPVAATTNKVQTLGQPK